MVDWIDLSDFSPGIFADIHGGIVNTSRGSIIGHNGAATIDGTFRCCSDPSGALVPLPVAVTEISQPLIPGGNAKGTTSYYPPGMVAAYLTDVCTFGPFNTTFTLDATNKDLSQQVIHATAWFMMFSPAGSSSAYRSMALVRLLWRDATTLAVTQLDILWESSYPTTFTGTPRPQISPVLVTPARGAYQNQPNGPLFFAHQCVAAAFGMRIIHTTGFAIPADELPLTTIVADLADRTNSDGVVDAPGNYPAGLMNLAGNSPLEGYLIFYPSQQVTISGSAAQTSYLKTIGFVRFKTGDASDQDALAANGASVNPLYQTAGPVRYEALASHQGRIVGIGQRLRAAGRALRLTSHLMMYSPPFAMDGQTMLSNGFFFGENNSGLSLIASLNTDELLFIRDSDGGVLVRGDIDNPTVVRLRNLESMYGVSHVPINTPLGLVYGTPNGVFAYQGGEVSVGLSPQLEGFFWNHTDPIADPDYEAQRGRFGLFHHWVCVPNNFLLDQRTKAWWRLSPPSDRGGVAYNCYTADPTNGDLFAFPYKLTATQNVVCDRFKRDVLASSYSWQSQPLVETLERVASFQECMLVASPGANTAECVVTVTLTGFDVDGQPVNAVPIVFNFVGSGVGQPVIRRLKFPNFQAMYVQVRIEASAVTGPAPKIHTVRLAHADRAQVTVT